MSDELDSERMAPRRFWLIRRGTRSDADGIVAEGTLWSSGRVALHWPGQPPATTLWGSLDDLLVVHGRDAVAWLDDSDDWRCEHVECVEYDAGAIWIH
ncbi:hypothetical protein E1263_35450 [Kribbella antibiotica]|uniref:Uncharacterized protein n=1 Tax=Kribbella antibiotica TaxID=190195 RepID=A0A4R4YTQ2_9ACTN|nr:hypothetical protein [Kribbella antibiotica]TDD46992.1 hypothetical protein E1263_35450 [Kribbella antibiotica]